MKPIKVYPKRWYYLHQWLSPKWWKRAKQQEKLLNWFFNLPSTKSIIMNKLWEMPSEKH
jgi:hypothetical protein